MAFLVHSAKKLSWFGLGGPCPPPGSATGCIQKPAWAGRTSDLTEIWSKRRPIRSDKSSGCSSLRVRGSRDSLASTNCV